MRPQRWFASLVGVLLSVCLAGPVVQTARASNDVYSVLDNLIVVGFDDNSAEPFVVVWDGITPTIFLGGEVLENLAVSYDKNTIKVVSLFARGTRMLTALSVNNDGNLVIQTSDSRNLNGAQYVVNSGNGTLIAGSSCRCYGGDLTTVRAPCTVAQCNDPGITCNTAGPLARCEWRAVGPHPSINRMQ